MMKKEMKNSPGTARAYLKIFDTVKKELCQCGVETCEEEIVYAEHIAITRQI